MTNDRTKKSTFGMKDLKKHSFSNANALENKNNAILRASQNENNNSKIAHSKSVNAMNNYSRAQMNQIDLQRKSVETLDENEYTEYGDEDEDEDDDESYGDESENEKEELQFENEYDDGQQEIMNQKDNLDMLRQKSTDLSSEASARSQLPFKKKQTQKKIEQIEEESISDDNLDVIF